MQLCSCLNVLMSRHLYLSIAIEALRATPRDYVKLDSKTIDLAIVQNKTSSKNTE
jgi:hypothetical protein